MVTFLADTTSFNVICPICHQGILLLYNFCFSLWQSLVQLKLQSVLDLFKWKPGLLISNMYLKAFAPLLVSSFFPFSLFLLLFLFLFPPFLLFVSICFIFKFLFYVGFLCSLYQYLQYLRICTTTRYDSWFFCSLVPFVCNFIHITLFCLNCLNVWEVNLIDWLMTYCVCYIPVFFQRIKWVQNHHSIFVTGLSFVPMTHKSRAILGDLDTAVMSISADQRVGLVTVDNPSKFKILLCLELM